MGAGHRDWEEHVYFDPSLCVHVCRALWSSVDFTMMLSSSVQLKESSNLNMPRTFLVSGKQRSLELQARYLSLPIPSLQLTLYFSSAEPFQT